MAEKPIRVLIIDDSRFFRDFMSKALSIDLTTGVVGVVSNPQEVFAAIRDLNPNVITLDIEIKNLSHREFIRRLRQEHPHIPIIVISPLSGNVFDALKAGAVDFVAKPSVQLHFDNSAFIKEVLNKIKTAYASSAVITPGRRAAVHFPAKAREDFAPPLAGSAVRSAKKPDTAAPPPPLLKLANPATKHIIAIGASTGGTEAILAVVRNLPANTPGIVIVQHMPPVFTRMYAERLDKVCPMNVQEASDGDRVLQGQVLIAEGGHQMRVMSDASGYYVRMGGTDKVSGHCPSVDVLFESVANVAASKAIGVILTGMGGDGAKNLLKMREAGAYTIGQDEASSVVYGMPMVAYNLGAVMEQLPLEAISGAIIRYLSK